MLLRFLKSLFFPRRERPALAPDEYPVMRMKRTARGYQGAPVDAHLRIAFGGLRAGERDLLEVVREALRDTGTHMQPYKVLHRPLASLFLARYYLHALGIEGARAECGVFMGTSALILSRIARSVHPQHDGTGLHLVDSFEGLSEPEAADGFAMPGPDGAPKLRTMEAGTFRSDAERVRSYLSEFPGIAIHQGWIPEVLSRLPESRWSFVHIDVDLYDPTYACMEYFYPRLASGGVMICDDYGAPLYPGAARAWCAYCEKNGIPFVVHDTGQSVILKA
jgi:hypothetical protein